jgi:hypothetical protein
MRDGNRRIGFAETEEATALALPSSVDLLLSSYKVAEKLTTTPTFDFLWNSVIDEGREKGLAVVAFSPWVDHMPGDPDGNSSSVVIAESALKVCCFIFLKGRTQWMLTNVTDGAQYTTFCLRC